jgi:hypothetical protein
MEPAVGLCFPGRLLATGCLTWSTVALLSPVDVLLRARGCGATARVSSGHVLARLELLVQWDDEARLLLPLAVSHSSAPPLSAGSSPVEGDALLGRCWRNAKSESSDVVLDVVTVELVAGLPHAAPRC